MKKILSLLAIITLTSLPVLAQTSANIRVNTLNALVQLPILSTNMSAMVSGNAAIGDGGYAGDFTYDSSSSLATNTYSVLKPAGTTGRWIRRNQSSYNQFSAVTVGDENTYALRIQRNLGTNVFAIGADNNNSYIQSHASYTLHLNNQGNNVVLNGTGSGGTVIGNTLTVTNAATLQNTLSVGGGAVIKAIYSASGELDFPSISASAVTNLTITVTGAGTNSTVVASKADGVLTDGIELSGYVSATNTVTIRAANPTVTAIDPATGSYRVTVFQY